MQDEKARQSAGSQLLGPGAAWPYNYSMGNLDSGRPGVGIGGGVAGSYATSQRDLIKLLNDFGMDFNDPNLKNKMLLKADALEKTYPATAEKMRSMANHIAIDLSPRSK